MDVELASSEMAGVGGRGRPQAPGSRAWPILDWFHLVCGLNEVRSSVNGVEGEWDLLECPGGHETEEALSTPRGEQPEQAAHWEGIAE